MKIENRHNALISIKPIDAEYKLLTMNFIAKLLKERKLNWTVQTAGRTTIEIKKLSLSKVSAIKRVLSSYNVKTLTYVGDEMEVGNDTCVRDFQHLADVENRLKCLHTSGPAMTSFFLKILENINE
jgi:hypothetical protein